MSDRLPTEEEYQKNNGRFIACDVNRVYQAMFDIHQGGQMYTEVADNARNVEGDLE